MWNDLENPSNNLTLLSLTEECKFAHKIYNSIEEELLVDELCLVVDLLLLLVM
jgi:hypothetical protein